jgi:hypothetical protein
VEPAVAETHLHVVPAMAGGATVKRTRLRRSQTRSILFVVVDVMAAAVAIAICGGTAAGAVVFGAGLVMIDLLDRRRAHRLTLAALDDAPALVLRGVVLAGAATVAGFPMAGWYVPGAREGAAWLVTAILFAALATVGRATGYTALRWLPSSSGPGPWVRGSAAGCGTIRNSAS